MAMKSGCCGVTSKAEKRYLLRMLSTMIFYLAMIWSVRVIVNLIHPVEWKLYAVCALPMIPIVQLVIVMGRYLSEERDEYKRMVQVKSMLWGMTAVFLLSTYMDLTRAFGNQHELPPFRLFLVFWVVMALASAVQNLMNRPKDDVVTGGDAK